MDSNYAELTVFIIYIYFFLGGGGQFKFVGFQASFKSWWITLANFSFTAFMRCSAVVLSFLAQKSCASSMALDHPSDWVDWSCLCSSSFKWTRALSATYAQCQIHDKSMVKQWKLLWRFFLLHCWFITHFSMASTFWMYDICSSGRC